MTPGQKAAATRKANRAAALKGEAPVRETKIRDVPPALQLHRDATFEAAAWRSELYAAIRGYADARLAEADAAWLASGECQRCAGHRSVLTWWTLDGPSWDEVGPCPECASDAVRAAGMMREPNPRPNTLGPTSRSPSRYDGACYWLAHRDTDFADWFFAIEAAEKEAEWTERISAGAIVIVAKGRKVTPGIIAPVVAVKDSMYGARVGLLVGQHVEGAFNGVLWTSLENVEIARGLPNELAAHLMITFEQNRAAFVASKGKTAKPFYRPEQWRAVGIKMEDPR